MPWGAEIVFAEGEIDLAGARARNRTENLGIKSPLLCQLSYAGAEATPPRPPEVDSTALTGTVPKGPDHP